MDLKALYLTVKLYKRLIQKTLEPMTYRQIRPKIF